jgi:hypothetical protein
MTAADVHEWVGRLAMTVRIAANDLPKRERTLPERTLEEFKRSDVCTPPLRQALEEQEPRP